MQNEKMVNKATELLQVRQKIKKIEESVLNELVSYKKVLSDSLIPEMMEGEETEIVVEGLGKVVLFEKATPKKYDEKKLMKALGVTDLKKFIIKGKKYKQLNAYLNE